MTYTDSKALAEEKLPVFLAFRDQECRNNKYGGTSCKRRAEISQVEEASTY